VQLHWLRLHCNVHGPSQRALHVAALHVNVQLAFAAHVGVHVAALHVSVQLLPAAQVGAHEPVAHSSSQVLPAPQLHAGPEQLVAGPPAPDGPIVKS